VKGKRETKGITLIALIITIIIMLILAGVTISIAINGGLFQQASTAKEKMTQEQGREDIIIALSEMQISELGKLDIDKIIDEGNDITKYSDAIIGAEKLDSKTLEIEHKNGNIYIITFDEDDNMKVEWLGSNNNPRANIELNISSAEGENIPQITLTVMATEQKTGIQYIKLVQTGEIQNCGGGTAEEKNFTITENGKYEVEVQTTAGRISRKSIAITITTITSITAALESNNIISNPNVSSILDNEHDGYLVFYNYARNVEYSWLQPRKITSIKLFGRIASSWNTESISIYRLPTERRNVASNFYRFLVWNFRPMGNIRYTRHRMQGS
jgi:hypothetical protein